MILNDNNELINLKIFSCPKKIILIFFIFQMTKVVHLFFMVKLIDLLDTVS